MIRIVSAVRRAHRRLADLVLITAISLAFAPAAYASGSSMPSLASSRVMPCTVTEARL